MATTKIMAIKSAGHLAKAANYAMDAAKTEDLGNVLIYASNGKKTNGGGLVTCCHCTPNTAAEKMNMTKKYFGKEGGRLGYHIVQSFKPGEVDAETAHLISQLYVEEWLRDYEVVIGTHTDCAHIHSHIVFNSVSCVTGRKFHMSKQEIYTKLRKYSDKVCGMCGLSVIEKGKSRDANTKYYKNSYSHETLKQRIVRDVEACIKRSSHMDGFYMELCNIGYSIDTSGKYVKVCPPDGKKNWRLETLGYSQTVIERMMLHKRKLKHRVFWPVGNSARKLTKKLTYFQALYLHYLMLFGKLSKTKNVSVPQDEYVKFKQHTKHLKFLIHMKIGTTQELKFRIDGHKSKLADLHGKLNDVSKEHSRHKKLYDAYLLCKKLDGQTLKEEQQFQYDWAKKQLERTDYFKKDNLDYIVVMQASFTQRRNYLKSQKYLLSRELRHMQEILSEQQLLRRFTDEMVKIEKQCYPRRKKRSSAVRPTQHQSERQPSQQPRQQPQPQHQPQRVREYYERER